MKGFWKSVLADRGRFLALLALAISTLAGTARAFTFAGESVESYSSCASPCSDEPNLSYSHDVVDFFVTRMTANGHTKRHQFKDGSVWASDLTEDTSSGQDNLYSDDGDIYIFCGHGVGSTSYFAPMCQSGTLSTCDFYGDNARWGERSGTAASPYAGNLRFVFLMTCFSVEDNNSQWNQTFSLGFDYLFGYRGLSADSAYTDEVAGDMADEVFGSTANGFKASWFWAVEDWWVDDTGGVQASGTTQTSANSRLDNMTKNYSRRPDAENHPYLARAFHQG